MKLQLFAMCVISLVCVSYANDVEVIFLDDECYTNIPRKCESDCYVQLAPYSFEDIITNMIEDAKEYILSIFQYVFMVSAHIEKIVINNHSNLTSKLSGTTKNLDPLLIPFDNPMLPFDEHLKNSV